MQQILLCLTFVFAALALSAQQLSKSADSMKMRNDSTGITDSSAVVFSPAPLIIDSAKTDSLSKKKIAAKRHSPGKAAWMSAVLPGLGQAYNKRWWKLPIVYAGFAGLGYGLYHFGTDFRGYRKAYRLAVDGDSTTFGSYKGVSGAEELRSYRDFNKRNLDILAVITALWYVLNIVDAAVDAHLFHWNVDDKLALDIQPMIPQIRGQAVTGLNFQLSFREPPKRKIFQL